ncbi:MAG: chromosome segregation protein SMC, partial [Pseudolabrys sp.]
MGAEAEASKRQALAAASLPELREAEAHAGAALHRLNVAQRDLDREETRAKDRIVELDLRLVQFAADTEREQRLAADAEQAIARLVAEEEAIRAEARESAGRRRGVDAKVSEADTELGAAERIFAYRTTELADLAAQRNLFENAAREQSERISRISSEIEAIERELATLHTGDVGPLAVAMEGTQVALSEAEAAAIAAEAAHNVARAEMETAQATLAESEKRVQRLETEAKTLSKMLSLETRSLWPPVIDHISVEKGYEKALGAALGDDLDAPVDPSSPMHWSGIAHEADDPTLPDGVATLAQYVKAPAQLTRRLSQIGVVERDAAIRLASSLKTGQRLVSREGDLWRWDGFVAAAHAPTGAARRLAQRSRFAEIDSELVSARSEVDANRRTVETAQAAFKAASSVETETRARERDLNRQAARLSALAEARARLNTSRDEATTAKADAEGSLIRLAPAAHLETKLAQVRDEISGKRARLAEVRAEQQAIVREAELADRRLAALAADRTGWIERQQGARKQIATLEQRTVEARRDRTELENAPQIFAEKRRALIAEVQTAETARQDCADRLQAAETALATADRDARAALEAASAAREEFARAEERFEAAKRRLSDIAREIRDMLEIEPSAVAELAEIGPTDPLPDLAEIEEKLERLRRERERLGAVNLRAEEELREVEVQHSSLTTERDDLVEAIKKLRLGIQSLNREARERLLASFEVVNTHFKHLFTQLFGGGTA